MCIRDSSYKKEEEKQAQKIDGMKTANADEYDIKKQNEVLQDTQNMLPNCKSRLQDALNDITSFLEENEADPSLVEVNEVAESKEQIQVVRDFLEQISGAVPE
eukprot:TRINITY_DN3780_c0_g1_i5.p2 TRINITY_DN3780_c0_g1~~TRINITY_DN3780_c0_g1_i5.p2  ORF type:complete len:103 (+),score=38.67 TRINITY_DN3780_c0_g1_i5:68-376(+)